MSSDFFVSLQHFLHFDQPISGPYLAGGGGGGGGGGSCPPQRFDKVTIMLLEMSCPQ